MCERQRRRIMSLLLYVSTLLILFILVNTNKNQYEIHCTFEPTGAKEDGGRVEWSAWKSYSQFQAFDDKMRDSYSSFRKRMVTVAFAPSHRVRSMFKRDQSQGFLEKRRQELDYYLQRIMAFTGVADFVRQQGEGSQAVSEFIDAPKHIDSSILSRSKSSASSKDSEEKPISYCRGRHIREQIEDEVADRFGEESCRRFHKQSKTFRRDENAIAASETFVKFITDEFGDRVFQEWLVDLYVKSIKKEEKRAALQAAMQTLKRRRKTKARERPLGKKMSSKELLAKVEEISEGDKQCVSKFRKAAKALGSQEMTPEEFIAFSKETFGEEDAREVVGMVTEAMPHEEVQQALRRAL